MRVLYVFLIVVIGLVSCNEAVESEASAQETTEVKEANVAELVSTEETTAEAIKTLVEEEKPVPVEKKAEVVKPKVPAKKPARIQFDSKEYQYGTIHQGDKFKHEFVFTNTGKSDLIIKDVTATCGCTQPSFPFIPIKPGKTGKIKVSYNSTGKLGAQRPAITVVSNGYPRRQVLHLNGVVLGPRKVAPPAPTPTPAPSNIIDEAPVDNGNVSKGISTDTTGN